MREWPGPERSIIAFAVGATAGMAGYVGLRGAGIPAVAAVPAVVLIGLLGTYWLASRLPGTLDGIRRKKLLMSVAWLLIALVALVQTARLSAFMLDPSEHQHSIFPGDPWLVAHCCLTAYTESARLAAEGEPNVYEENHYAGRKVESFSVDLYHYPPTFLLLPMAMRAIAGGEFLAVRELWFSASALTFMLAIGLIALRMEPAGRLRVIGMAPLIWCSMPVLVGLQMSNVQILVLATSALALVLFSSRTPAGALALAASMVAKIFPGMLFIYLIARRKWREVAWTTAAGIALTVLAFLVVGPASFQSFFEHHLPRLSSGEAFARPFAREFAVARNMSPFGIPLKLGALGVDGMTLEVGRVVSMVYLAGIVGLAIWAGRRRPRSGTEAASVWISLVSLGTLASPFAPSNYVLVSLVWLVCMHRELFRPTTAVIIWLLICLPFLVSREAPFLFQAAAHLPAQALALGVPVVVLWKAGAKRAGETVAEERSVLTLD
ncbi:MAG: rane protein [Bacteroidetes bacterium]|nr:rane protein [Bacteroidota bacterium]